MWLISEGRYFQRCITTNHAVCCLLGTEWLYSVLRLLSYNSLPIIAHTYILIRPLSPIVNQNFGTNIVRLTPGVCHTQRTESISGHKESRD